MSTATHGEELAALIGQVAPAESVVLVGHSYGGLVVRAAASEHPSMVAGMVLVDAAYSSQWKDENRYWHEGGTTIDMALADTATAGKPQLGQQPLFVLTASQGSDATWLSEQQDMESLSSNSTHVTVDNSEHVIMKNNPAAVVEAISQVRDAAADQTAMKSCDDLLWEKLFSHCS